MESDKKLAWSVVWVFIFVILCFIGLLGWGFVELIQWVTSK